MTLRFLLFALMLVPTSTNAASWLEEDCRRQQAESFDGLMKVCPELKLKMSRGELSRDMYGRSVCVSLPSPFIPTTKIPDWATYREMWVELRTAFCVTFPRTKE